MLVVRGIGNLTPKERKRAQEKRDAKSAKQDFLVAARQGRKDLLAQAKAAPDLAAAATQATDAESRSKLMKAVPWILGGVAVVAIAVWVWKKRRK
jgi:ferric-dicitrate binding protein FerR (iron transport regulator)